MGGNASTELIYNIENQRSNATTVKSNTENQRSNATTVKSNTENQRSIVTTEKCYDPQDTTLTFVEGDDDLDFVYMNYKSLKAKMSCGHAVTPMSLTDWCRRLLNDGKCRFVCGCRGCDVEWPYKEVRKMALLTPKEKEEFEKKMFENARGCLHVKVCPGCKSYAARTDHRDLSVKCTVCTAEKRRKYMFCWQCLDEWKGPVPRFDRCGNDHCGQPLEILRNCPDIDFKSVRGVTGCPSIRACPTCGMLVQHDKTGCKNITCGCCKVEFCFVCLKLTKECKKQENYSHFTLCSTGVAPRQTSIPVRQRK